MSFLQCVWKTLAPMIEKNQQSLSDKFFGGKTLLKNSEVIRGKKGRKTEAYKYEISDNFWKVIHTCKDIDYYELLYLIIVSLEDSIQNNIKGFYSDGKKAASLAFLDQVKGNVLSWFDKPCLYEIEYTTQTKHKTSGNTKKLPKRVYRDHQHSCNVVFTACLATMYWFGLQLRTMENPHNDYLDILSYVSFKNGNSGMWADIFSLDERVCVFVNGSSETKRISNIKVDLTEIMFLLPFPDTTDFEGTVPDGDEWLYAQKTLDNAREELARIGKEVFDSLRQNKDGMRENTPIVGVLSIKSVLSGVTAECELYRTDYYTHRVIEKLKEQLNINARTLSYPFTEDKTNAWRRTSLGVNVILVLESCSMLVLVKRSKLAQYGNEGKIYPSVVETIDLLCRRDGKNPDDFDNNEYDNAVVAATVRGLREELGITSDLFQIEDIHVCSAFHTRDYDQDNFFVVVTLHNTDFEAIRNCIRNAPDYNIENSDIYSIRNDARDILRHILTHQDDMINQTIYCLVEYVRRFLKQ